MRYFYRKPYCYRLSRVPKALRRARLDNIAIVPASMLTSQNTLNEKVRRLPRRQVLLCHTRENTRQRRLLERVKEVFRQLGYAVTLLPMEQVG
jgi:hypothetical protein